MHIHPSHVVSINLDRGFRTSLQAEASDRVRVLWGVTTARPLVPSDEEELAAFRADTRATFDAINLEDRQIVGAPKSGHLRPGRLCPGEKTLREFRRHLAMRLT